MSMKDGLTEYLVAVESSPGEGKCQGQLWVKINGTKGSTGFVNLGRICGNDCSEYVNFRAPFVDNIVSIDASVKSDRDDGWFPKSIVVRQGDSATHIMGGKWVHQGEIVNFAVSAKIYSVTINAKNAKKANTNGTVYVTLEDYKGVSSEKLNATMMSKAINALECGDKIKLLVGVPKDFGTLKIARFEFGDGFTVKRGCWLESIGVKMLGGNSDEACYIKADINKWGKKGEPVIVRL